MVTTKFTCPHCGAILRTQQTLTPEQTITCPKCARAFALSAVATQPVAPEPGAFAATQSFPGDAPAVPRPAAGRKTVRHEDEDWEDARPRSQPRKKRSVLLWAGVAVFSVLAVGGVVLGALFWVSNWISKQQQAAQVAQQPQEVKPPIFTPPTQQNPGPEPVKDDDQPAEPGPPAPPREPVFADGTPWVGLGLNNQALDIDGEDLDGKRFRLSDYRGKVVLVDFWADWCVHCRGMYNHEKELVRRLDGKPFVLLGINGDKSKTVAKRAIEKNGLTWRSWWDGVPTGMPISRQWGTNTLPRLFLLDHKGVIRLQMDGAPRDPATALDPVIDKLVKGAEAEHGGAISPGAPPAGEAEDIAAPKP
jgi:thiol-disulfide isomerase/thioredoxin